MATYKEIQDEVRNIGGITVKTCWIADVKEDESLPVRRAWNRHGHGEERENSCPRNIKPIIQRAMRNLGML